MKTINKLTTKERESYHDTIGFLELRAESIRSKYGNSYLAVRPASGDDGPEIIDHDSDLRRLFERTDANKDGSIMYGRLGDLIGTSQTKRSLMEFR